MSVGTMGLVRGSGLIAPAPDQQRIADLRKRLVRDDSAGHFLPSREHLLRETMPYDVSTFQQRTLAWLRDHVNPGIPRAWYNLVLGHDLHVSTWAVLHVKQFHANEVDPFTGDLGWLENIGLVSMGKVTAAFINFEALMLVTDTTVIGDFKFHEAGTGTTPEANTDTALGTPSGVARVAGTQTNPTAPTYQSVATLTANATQTWSEHGVFSAATGATLMDRSILSPVVPVVNLDTCQFTYTLTKTPEP